MKKYSTALICTILITAWILYMKNTDYVTNWFLIIMVAILCIEAKYARKKLLDVTASIQRVTAEYVCSKKVNYNTILSNDSIDFENEFLNKLYESYIEDVRSASKSNDSFYYDIADYINQENICKYIHKDITDQVSNTMTGLGILGTFVGLIVGLTHFNTSSTQEITNGIENLLGGIKTAFHTSIVGVCISLIYNYFYYRDLENNSKAIEDFCNAFYKNVMPSPEHQFLSDLLKCQYEQTKCLEALAGSIAGELAPRFAEEMGKTVTPVMERLNESIDDYIIKAVDAQSETLGKIVKNFMVHLNKALDDQFNNLSKSIKEMCQWHSDGAENIRVIITSLGEMANDIKGLSMTLTSNGDIQRSINETSEELFEKTKRYVNSLVEFKDAVEKQTQSTITHQENLEAILNNNLEHNNNVNNNILNSLSEFKDVVEQQIQSNLNHHTSMEELLDKNIESNKSFTENVLILTNEIKEYAAKSSDMSEAYSRKSDEMIEYSKQTTERLSAIEKLVNTLGETNKGIASIKVCCENFISEIDMLNKNVNTSTNVLTGDIQSVRSEISNINKDNVLVDEVNSLNEVIKRMEFVQQRIGTVLGQINQFYTEEKWLEIFKRKKELKGNAEEKNEGVR